MSELRECPNPWCKSEKIEMDHVSDYEFWPMCMDCGNTGPSTATAPRWRGNWMSSPLICALSNRGAGGLAKR